MAKGGWIKAGIVAIFAVPLATVVFSAWRFRFEPTWRMDPIPFAFFVASAFFVGRLSRKRGRSED